MEKKHHDHPELREAHKALAHEVICDLHGEKSYQEAVKISESLFSGDIKNFTSKEVEMAFKGLDSFVVEEDLNVVDYYHKDYEERWGATFPCGLYVDIPDYRGVYNRWLVVGLAQSNNAQFPTYEILRVNYLFTWVFERTKYLMAGVQRNQNS